MAPPAVPAMTIFSSSSPTCLPRETPFKLIQPTSTGVILSLHLQFEWEPLRSSPLSNTFPLSPLPLKQAFGHRCLEQSIVAKTSVKPKCFLSEGKQDMNAQELAKTRARDINQFEEPTDNTIDVNI